MSNESVTPEVKVEVTPAVTPEVKTEVTPAVTPEVKTEVKPEVKPEVKVEGAPEAYTDFTVPEGATLDKGIAESLKATAKELNLPQAQAQLLVDKMSPVFTARAQEQITQMKSDLLEASKADKEFGGEKLAASVADAKLVLDAFFKPEFSKFLDETGLGNHPEMIRGFLKMAPHVKSDSFVKSDNPSQPKTLASWFPNTKS